MLLLTHLALRFTGPALCLLAARRAWLTDGVQLLLSYCGLLVGFGFALHATFRGVGTVDWRAQVRP